MREKDGKYYAAAGTKGYRWLESEMVRAAGREADVDISYYEKLALEAKEAIMKYAENDGNFEWFVNSDTYENWPPDDDLPF